MIREPQITYKIDIMKVRISELTELKIDVDENYRYNRWAVFVETLFILGFAGFYVHYIKNMLETKRLLM